MSRQGSSRKSGDLRRAVARSGGSRQGYLARFLTREPIVGHSAVSIAALFAREGGVNGRLDPLAQVVPGSPPGCLGSPLGRSRSTWTRSERRLRERFPDRVVSQPGSVPGVDGSHDVDANPWVDTDGAVHARKLSLSMALQLHHRATVRHRVAAAGSVIAAEFCAPVREVDPRRVVLPACGRCSAPLPVVCGSVDTHGVEVVVLTRCRKCEECKVSERSQWVARCVVEAAMSRQVWFFTLTVARDRPEQLDARLLPVGRTLAEVATDLAVNRAYGRAACDQFARALRRAVPWPDCAYLVCPETHKSGHFHAHALVFARGGARNVPELVAKCWPHGFTTPRRLRHRGGVAYVSKYCVKAVGLARIRSSVAFGTGRFTAQDFAGDLASIVGSMQALGVVFSREIANVPMRRALNELAWRCWWDRLPVYWRERAIKSGLDPAAIPQRSPAVERIMSNAARARLEAYPGDGAVRRFIRQSEGRLRAPVSCSVDVNSPISDGVPF